MKSPSTTHAVIVLLSFAAGVTLLHAGPQSPPPQAVEDRAIYTPLLEVLLRTPLPSAMVVQGRPLRMPMRPMENDWQWLGAPAALRPAVDSNWDREPAPFSPDSFPSGTRLLERQAIDEFFRAPPPVELKGLDDRWRQFRLQFGAASYEGFSRPIVSADGLSALVWYSHSCGPLCGEAGFAFLQRPRPDAPWHVAKRLPKVVS